MNTRTTERRLQQLEQRIKPARRHFVYWPDKGGQTFEEFCKENNVTEADNVHRISWLK